MDYVYPTDLMSYQQQYQNNDQKEIPNDEMQIYISALLSELVDQGDIHIENISDLISFNSPKIPSIPIYDYIGRILTQAQCSQECLIIGIIFIDRLSQKHKKIVARSINIHRLYVISVMIAAKFHDDRFFQNQYYAKVAGISKEEFNKLEEVFLEKMDYRLLINPGLFLTYRKRIIMAYQENI